MKVKNKRGEMNMVVIGIVIAIILLAIALRGPIKKIMGQHTEVSNIAENTCEAALNKCMTPEGPNKDQCPDNRPKGGGTCAPDKDKNPRICCVQNSYLGK